MVCLRAEFPEGCHNFPTCRLALLHDLGRMDQAYYASRNDLRDLPFVALQSSLVSSCPTLDSPSDERGVPGKIAGHGWPFFGLGCDRMGKMPVHLGFSMVSLVRHSMGEAGHSSGSSLDRGLERFILPCVFQSCSRFLRPSLAGSKEKWKRRDAFLLLPGFLRGDLALRHHGESFLSFEVDGKGG